jgi:hypothetical protein
MPNKSKAVEDSQETAQSGRTNKPKRFARLRSRKQKPDTPPKKVSGSFRLFMDSASLVRQHWKLFGGITLVYLLLSLILVGGFGKGFDLSELNELLTEEFGQLSASIALFGLLLGSTGNAASESGTVYQVVVTLLITLATIWALRQALVGEKVQIRDAFYKGMYPLVPFVLVLFFICLLFIPALIASFIFNTVFGGGLAGALVEQVAWAGLILLLVGWSLHLLVTFVFGIYIVTLPDVRPVAALKAARKLVLYRRWSVTRKLLFLPLAFIVISAVIVLPLIMLTPMIVQWSFAVLSMFALIFAHTYLYSLYKELL